MLMKFIFILAVMFWSLQADSLWDSATQSASSLWEKTKQVSSDTFDKTKQITSDTLEQTKQITSKTWDKTKEYSHKGKNRVLEQTLSNGINALVDTSKIKIESFDINDTTDCIDAVIALQGESQKLKIKIKNFQWSVSKDEQYIIVHHLDMDINIGWIRYLITDMIKRDGENLVLPYQASTYSLLYAIKDNVPFDKELHLYQNFDFVNYPYDKNYVDIKYFIVKNGEISVNVVLKDSEQPFVCVISDYKFNTANKKTLIVLRNLKFEKCTKPWIQSIIEKQGNQVQFVYSDKLYGLFVK